MDASPPQTLIPRRPGRRQVAFGLLVLGLAGVSGAAITVYLQREAIGVRLGLDYLRAHGVPAELKLDRLDLGGVSGSLRLGPGARPDLTVGRMEAEFGALPAPWRGVRPPPIRALRLIQPVLHVRLRDGRLDFGTLQPLVDQSLAAQPSGAPPPDLFIRDGRLQLDTPSGPVEVMLDADIASGRVRSLHARLAPADLAALGLRVGQVQGVLSGQSTGAGALHLTAAFSAAGGHAARGKAAGLTLSLEALTPNGPAGLLQLGDRPLDAVVRLQASRFALQPRQGPALDVRGADLTLDLDGGVARDGAFAGKLHARGRAAQLAREGLELDGATLELTSDDAKAAAGKPGAAKEGTTRAEPTAAGPFTLALAVHGGRLQTAAGPATLAPASLTAAGRLTLDHGVDVQAKGALQAGAGLGPADAVRLARRTLGGLDATAGIALARALQRVSLRAPAYSLSYDSRDGAVLRLPQGLQALVAGGALTLRPQGRAPVLETHPTAAAAGAFSAALQVGGLPQVQLDARRFARSAAGDVQLDGALAVQGGLGPVRGAALRVAGRMSGRGDRWSFAAQDCATISVASLVSQGRAQAADIHALLCPNGAAPVLSYQPRAWSVAAVARDVGVSAPAAQVKAQLGSATILVGGAAGAGRDPSGRVEVRGLAVQDTAPVARVRPLGADGTVTLAAGRAQGRFTLVLAQHATPLGTLAFSATTANGAGEAVLDTGRLSFAAKGLQPGDIAPAAARDVPEAQGPVQVIARAAWTKGGLATSGEVRTPGFSFKSPAGKIDGLRGDIRLTSLTPLLSAPGQTLDADRLETLVPLTRLHAGFTLAADHLDLGAASADVAGGRASLDPMRLPLTAGQPVSGVLRIKDMDLDKLIAVLNLANSVSLKAQLGGDLPFALQPEAGGGTAIRFDDGRLYAEGPGRLTIRRQALTGAVATAGAQGAQPNAVQDFAYQALENLAFSQLDAKVASRPGGRLGVVFHVVGRHDPLVDRPTRIGLFALLRGHAFDKPLPLPKGTPVELTLDTSLNLDDILAAYGQMNGAPAAGSAKVQP